jgi:hypothetical protein
MGYSTLAMVSVPVVWQTLPAVAALSLQIETRFTSN